MSDKKSQSDRIVEVIGFDHRSKGGGSVLEKAREQVQKERAEKHQEACSTLIRQAIEVDEKMTNLRKELEGKLAKSGKELNNLLKKIEVFGGGAPYVEEDESDNSGSDS